jgi:hypothetical protein
MFRKIVAGARHRDSYCIQPQAALGVPTVSLPDEDIQFKAMKS